MRDVCFDLAHRLVFLQWQLATAESCTGGLIAARCTDLPGSSQWFDRGFVTYSNAAKSEMLGVCPSLIAEHGAVSESVAAAMALGAVYRSNAQASLAVTGIAGPDGGTTDKPVGTVCFAWCVSGRVSCDLHIFSGNREQVRAQTCEHALKGLLSRLHGLA